MDGEFKFPREGIYADLGNGWYFAHNQIWMMVMWGGGTYGYVADSRHPEPDVMFRDGAWDEGIGPMGGRTLVAVGGMSYDYPFPGRVKVLDPGIEACLGHLEGRVVDSLDELVEILGIGGISRELNVFTDEQRRGWGSRKLPGRYPYLERKAEASSDA